MKPPTDPPTPPDPNNPPIALRSSDQGEGSAAGAAMDPPIITASIPAPPTSSSRQAVSTLLNLSLVLFLAVGIISLLDDSLVLLFGLRTLTIINGLFTSLALLVVLLLYVLMGLTPIIPKRVFLPIVLYHAGALLSLFPVLIYGRQWLLRGDWLLSLVLVALILGIVAWLQGTWKLRWPWIEAKHLGATPFNWRTACLFLLLNLAVLLPGLVAYLMLCTSLAISHYTDGFLALRPAGLILQARQYSRPDGKTIVLFPMSHIAETDFYQAVSQSVTTNSVVLLEGVSDRQHLLTNQLSYRRAAKSLGLAEQHDDLNIRRGELVRADVDIQEFSPTTIGLLNLAARVHAQGLTPANLRLLMECSPSPHVEQSLISDLLIKRNEHLLKELRARLPDSDHFVIPWGAAHMPGIAKEIQKSGFRVVETHDYVSIRIGPNPRKGYGAEKAQDSEKSK